MNDLNDMLPSEREGKWLLRDLNSLHDRLIQAGAVLAHPRRLERNLRFDTPERRLLREYQVLRLRQDAQARLTYKGSPTSEEGISRRTEIEFTVGDFDAAHQLLESLGYEVIFIYEKHRCEYKFMDCLVMLDELPFGDFIEIEGASAQAIHRAADALCLRWEAASTMSYHALFEQYRNNSGLSINNLTFSEFFALPVKAEWLGLRFGDDGE